MCNRVCKVDECEKEVKALGMCNAHYLRFKRYGNALAGAPPRMRDVGSRERLEAYGRREGECIVWTRSRNATGYGIISVDGKPRLAHRVSYELESGPLPKGMVVDHVCFNPACFNPAHLRAATHRQNMQYRESVHPTSSTGIRGVRNAGTRAKPWEASWYEQGIHKRSYYGSVDEAELQAVRMRLKYYDFKHSADVNRLNELEAELSSTT